MRDLLCYAHGTNQSWEALCVDLDLAVQGVSREDVMARLEEAVIDYVRSAMQEEPAVAEQLLNRRAPLQVRVSHWFRFQWYMLTRKRQHNGTAIEYGLPCPA